MRRFALLVLAGLTLAVPASAPADPAATWFFNRVAIPAGQVKEVPLTSGANLTVVVKEPGMTGVKYPCSVTGTEAFWNMEGAARDETRSIAFTCTGATVVAYLPWTSTLLPSETLPLLDRWEGMALEVNGEVFTGSLDAKVGDTDPESTKEKEGTLGDLDNSVSWRFNSKRVLLAPSGNKSWLIGSFKLGTKEAGITDEATDG